MARPEAHIYGIVLLAKEINESNPPGKTKLSTVCVALNKKLKYRISPLEN